MQVQFYPKILQWVQQRKCTQSSTIASGIELPTAQGHGKCLTSDWKNIKALHSFWSRDLPRVPFGHPEAFGRLLFGGGGLYLGSSGRPAVSRRRGDKGEGGGLDRIVDQKQEGVGEGPVVDQGQEGSGELREIPEDDWKRRRQKRDLKFQRASESI